MKPKFYFYGMGMYAHREENGCLKLIGLNRRGRADDGGMELDGPFWSFCVYFKGKSLYLLKGVDKAGPSKWKLLRKATKADLSEAQGLLAYQPYNIPKNAREIATHLGNLGYEAFPCTLQATNFGAYFTLEGDFDDDFMDDKFGRNWKDSADARFERNYIYFGEA